MSTVETLNPRRWRALALLAASFFMIILDTSIVTVALPSMQADLGFSDGGLAWVLNAYVLVFGAGLLLGGRAADLFGRRRVFILGMAVFTIASLVAGLATGPEVLIGARLLQGLGGAIVSPAALSIVMELFTDAGERNKAMGIWGASAPAGGATGVLLGGVFADTIGWEWVFYVNVPVGVIALVLAGRLLPVGRTAGPRPRLDLGGALTAAGGLGLAVYAIMQAEVHGFGSARVLGLFGGAVLLLAAFVLIESKVREPLIPLGVFRNRNLSAGAVAMFLLGAAWIPAWYFISLYMQRVLHMKSLNTGLGYLPMTLLIMGISVLFIAKAVGRFGFKANAVFGLLVVTAGVTWFGLAPVDGSYASVVLPASLVLGVGMAFAYVPVTIASLSNVGPGEAGLASGLINTTYQIGSAVGLAVTVAVATATSGGGNGEVTDPAALNDGYGAGFLTAAGLAAAAVLLTLIAVRGRSRDASSTEELAKAAV